MNNTTYAQVEADLFGDVNEEGNSANRDRRLRLLTAVEHWLGFGEIPSIDKREVGLRFAASLISRTDAQLYGTSMPRFAVRSALGESPPHSFMNLRRPALFRAEVAAVQNSGSEAAAGGVPNTQQGDIGYHRLIGDCVLGRPSWVPDGYKILTSAHGPAYGEEHDFEGTPYVQYSDLSGACAHAVCYMASMILRDYCGAVYGLPEIAALLEEEPAQQFTIQALTPQDISRYFGHNAIRLRSIRQHVQEHPNAPLRPAISRYATGIRNYIFSGMPVIVPVDLLRLHGWAPQRTGTAMPPASGSVFETAKTSLRILEPSETGYQPMHHFVLVIGCGPDHEDSHIRFLIHDPYLCPYLPARIRQLDRAATYADATMSSLHTRTFQSVTPSEVRLGYTYGTDQDDSNNSLCLGLTEVSLKVLHVDSDARIDNPILSSHDADEVCALDFRLARLRDVPSRIGDGNDQQWRFPLGTDIRTKIQKNVKELVDQADNSFRDRWVWVQQISRAVILWDAQRPVPAQVYYRDPRGLRTHMCGYATEHSKELRLP